LKAYKTAYRNSEIIQAGRDDMSYVDLDSIRVLFFYEYSHATRTVLALFSPSTSEGHIFIVNKVRVDLAGLDSLYRAELKK
jgi:hypothetical protein